MGCLDDPTLDDLVQGRLSGDGLRSAEAHLDSCASCSELVGLLAGGAKELETELTPGTRIGRHVLIRRLGRGAMGVVYLAEDPELGRQVALKLILPGAGFEEGERTLREAQALARLAHPNVVAIYDVGRAGDRLHFAMEFVSGSTLRAWLSAAPRSRAETLNVMLQAGRGLAAAHAARIVHRDFKPENVMVGDDSRVRVTDFGLARSTEPTRGVDASFPVRGTLTRTGGLVGTPLYMAPEQLTAGVATERSDQFAFAVTLYEAISGARPFSAETTRELAEAMRRGASDRPLRELPRRLREAILRALDPDPERRFVALDELLAQIERALAPTRRWPFAMAIGAAAATLATAAVALNTRVTRDPCDTADAKVARVWSPARGGDVDSAFRATGSAFATTTAAHVVARLDSLARTFAAEYRTVCEATHVRREQSETMLDARTRCLDRRLGDVDALVSTFERADSATVRGAVSALAELPTPEECGQVESLGALDPRPADPARARRLEALERSLSEIRALGVTGRYAGALELARKAAQDAHQLGYRPAIAEAELLVATLARRTADFELAGKSARKALVAAQAAHADRTAARVWLELLAIDGERGKPARVAENAELALAALQRIDDPADLRAALLLEVGTAHTLTGALDDAERELTRCLELRQTAHGGEHILISRTLTALGNLSRARGDLPRALERHERALAIDRKLLGPAHPVLATHHHNIAGVLRLQGRRPDALTRYQRALVLERAAFGANHPRVALTENSIGLLLLETSDVHGAREHLERALAVWTPARHPDRALGLSNLGIADAMERRAARAVEHFSEAIAIVERALGADHLRIAGIRLHRARSLRELKKLDDATRDLREAQRIARLHASESLEARTLDQQITTELAQSPRALPARPPAPRNLGSTSYGAKNSWDSD